MSCCVLNCLQSTEQRYRLWRFSFHNTAKSSWWQFPFAKASICTLSLVPFICIHLAAASPAPSPTYISIISTKGYKEKHNCAMIFFFSNSNMWSITSQSLMTTVYTTATHLTALQVCNIKAWMNKGWCDMLSTQPVHTFTMAEIQWCCPLGVGITLSIFQLMNQLLLHGHSRLIVSYGNPWQPTLATG